MESKESPFDYTKFGEPQVSRAALRQGFELTRERWLEITRLVEDGLAKRGISPNRNLRSLAAKDAAEEVRIEMLIAHPELSFHVPPQWLKMGTYQIIRVVHSARKSRSRAKAKSRASSPKVLVPAASIAEFNDPAQTGRLTFNTVSSLVVPQDQSTKAESLKEDNAPTVDAIPSRDLASKSASFDMLEEDYEEHPLIQRPDAQADIPDARPASSLVHWENNPTASRSPAKTPAPANLIAARGTTVNLNLMGIQLWVTVMNDRSDTSFVNLSELLVKNTLRTRAMVYATLEDITDQDWEYYHAIYLPSDLDGGFQLDSDKMYFDNGIGDMVRIKNGTNWRAAMVAMQGSGATQFRFHLDRRARVSRT